MARAVPNGSAQTFDIFKDLLAGIKKTLSISNTEKFIKTIVSSRFGINDGTKQISDVVQLLDTDVKKKQFAAKVKKMKTQESMANSVIHQAAHKGTPVVPEGMRQLRSEPHGKTAIIKTNVTNWNNYAAISNFINNANGKEIKDVSIDKLEDDKQYNRHIFVANESKAANIIGNALIKVALSNAAVALLIPHSEKQASWIPFRPKQVSVFLEQRETKKLVSHKAWLLQLGDNEVELGGEDVEVVADIPKVVEMTARRKKQYTDETLWKKCWRNPDCG